MRTILLNLLMHAVRRGPEQEWRRAAGAVDSAQADRLAAILYANRDTAYGRMHDFASIDGPDAYRRAVPLVRYEDLAPCIHRMRQGEENVLVAEPVEMFTITSGTTGEPKFLPVTASQTQEAHRSHRLWMGRLVADHPRLAGGSLLSIVSPAEEGRTQGGTPYGSASGKVYREQAWAIRRQHAVPYEVFRVEDYDARHYCLLAFALAADLTLATSVNPSSLVLLARRMREWSRPLVEDIETSLHEIRSGSLSGCPGELPPSQRRAIETDLHARKARARHLRTVFDRDGELTPRTAWPHLQAICTWHGGNAPFYLSQLADLWGRVPTRCLGLRASEGVFSIPVEDRTPEGLLAVWGPFFEFLPEDQEPSAGAGTLLAHQLEAGRRYRVIVTTSGGLYRYDMGDIVEVTRMEGSLPVVAFLHKAGKVLSITGEKVTENQVVEAMRAAAEDWRLEGFSVTLRKSDPPHYALAVEPHVAEAGRLQAHGASLAERFDRELGRRNVEYRSKRDSGRLGPVEVRALPAGAYLRWRQREVEAGRPEGQIKPPHLLRDDDELQTLTG